MSEAPARSIVRIILIIVGVALALYLIYLLRKPIGWVFTAAFIAVALSGPVNWLTRRMRRGLAIAVVFLVLLAIPSLIGALLVPPLVTEADNFAQNVPEYASDVSEFVRENERLRRINEDYDITTKLEEEAAKLPEQLGGAAETLGDIGVGLVNSIFAMVMILVLTAFLLGSGRRWVDAALELRPPEQARRLRRTLDGMSAAVSGYVAGVLVIAVIAGVSGYIVLSVLGVPFRGALALIIGLFALIPLIGATIAAVIVGVVTLFNDFPTDTIVWTVWAIVYQQVENHVIQPQIQRRTVDVHPFIVVVSVLFGATLLGVPGAIIAIPAAASIQVVLREYWDFRAMAVRRDPGSGLAPAPEQ